MAVPYSTYRTVVDQHVREQSYTVPRQVVTEYQVAVPYSTYHPVVEQHVREQSYTVNRPVVNEYQEPVSHTVYRTVVEQHVRDERYTTYRTVVEPYQVPVTVTTVHPVGEQHVRGAAVHDLPDRVPGVPGAGHLLDRSASVRDSNRRAERHPLPDRDRLPDRDAVSYAVEPVTTQRVVQYQTGSLETVSETVPVR